jgi:hypothetical protein
MRLSTAAVDNHPMQSIYMLNCSAVFGVWIGSLYSVLYDSIIMVSPLIRNLQINCFRKYMMSLGSNQGKIYRIG